MTKLELQELKSYAGLYEQKSDLIGVWETKHMCTAIPKLIDRIEKLEKALEEIELRAKSCHYCGSDEIAREALGNKM